MKNIKGISVRQPWADLIVKGAKTLELRKTIPEEGLPDYLLIHAPKKIDFQISCFYGFNQPWTLISGKYLAIVKVERLIMISENNHLEYLYNHRQPFPLQGEYYGILISMHTLLPNPIEADGHLNLFQIPQIVLEEITKFL